MIQVPPDNGLCIGQPVEWWYPDLLTRNPREIRMQMRMNSEKALTICGQCPVIETCRDYALGWELYGIWGGMTEKERRDYRLKNNIPYLRPSPSEVVAPIRNA